MPDTTYIISSADSATVQKIIDSLTQDQGGKVNNISGDKPVNIGYGIPALLVFAFFITVGFLSIKRVLRSKDEPTSADQNIGDYYVYKGYQINMSDDEFSKILLKYFPYYYGRSFDLKKLFIERLKTFIAHKDFIVCTKDGYKEMPVLLSAAAIQLTFGLDDYVLPYFKNIKIHSEEYYDTDDGVSKFVQGNIDPNTINISWSNFLKGIADPNDADNVGLHEMAHALYFQFVQVDASSNNFKLTYNIVMQKCNTIFQAKDHHQLFIDYAFTNLQEFWAVSVEVFFERPADFQVYYPDLYGEIKALLNQNPLNKRAPVSNESV